VLTRVDPRRFELMDYMRLSMNIFPMSRDYAGIETYTPVNCEPTVAEIGARWKGVSPCKKLQCPREIQALWSAFARDY